MNNSNERNLGIDLLRIVSMILIMLLHVLGQGGILKSAEVLSTNYDVAYFLEVLAYPSVAIFGMIMGYVGLNRRHSLSGWVYVFLQVLFYTIITTLIFMFAGPFVVSHLGSEAGIAKASDMLGASSGFGTFVGLSEIRKMFTPVMTEQYWYITAYLGLYFFMDGINHVINTMPRAKCRVMLIASVLLFSVLPVTTSVDAYSLKYGCSIICVFLFYSIGAYVRKYDIGVSLSNLNLVLIYLLSILFTWFSKIGIETFIGYSEDAPDRGNILINFHSPTVIIAGLMLLLLFSRMRIGKRAATSKDMSVSEGAAASDGSVVSEGAPVSEGESRSVSVSEGVTVSEGESRVATASEGALAKVIRVLTPLTLGVYLSDTHPLIFTYLMDGRFSNLATGPVWKLIVCAILSAFVIYLVGIVIDAVRYFIFEVFHLRKKLKALENYLDNRLRKKEDN